MCIMQDIFYNINYLWHGISGIYEDISRHGIHAAVGCAMFYIYIYTLYILDMCYI